jgi:hypothetical protein
MKHRNNFNYVGSNRQRLHPHPFDYRPGQALDLLPEGEEISRGGPVSLSAGERILLAALLAIRAGNKIACFGFLPPYNGKKNGKPCFFPLHRGEARVGAEKAFGLGRIARTESFGAVS